MQTPLRGLLVCYALASCLRRAAADATRHSLAAKNLRRAAADATRRSLAAKNLTEPRLASIVLVDHRVSEGVYRAILDFARALPNATTHWFHEPKSKAAHAMIDRLHREGVSIIGHGLRPPPKKSPVDIRFWYNRLFASDTLWWQLPPTHALVIQADAGVCGTGRFDPKWLRYDFVGAPNAVRRYNGGLSLRRIDAQRSANKVNFGNAKRVNGHLNEDTLLYNYCQKATSCALAPRHAADRFALEAPTRFSSCLPPNVVPWGYHKAYAYRCRDELRAACPNAAWRFHHRSRPAGDARGTGPRRR